MDLLGKISKSIEKFLQKHSSKRTYWKTETWHGSSRQHLTGNGSMDLLKISKFVQLKNWKNSSKRACWKTETFKRDIFFSSFLRILHIYILSPPFFFRPPRRTTRFTDRNEQPAVKVDVHVLLLLLRSSSAFHRPTFDECCRGGKFAARKKKTIRSSRSRVCKKGKKKSGRTPARFPVCQKPCGKRGRREGTKLAFRDFHRCIRVCLFCLPVSRRTSCFHVFEAREVVAPEGEREGEGSTNRRCRLKFSELESGIWNIFGIFHVVHCLEKFRVRPRNSLLFTWRGETRLIQHLQGLVYSWTLHRRAE